MLIAQEFIGISIDIYSTSRYCLIRFILTLPPLFLPNRKLGVHVSQVRSLVLDVWEPEMVAVMESMGNVNSNEIFEKVALPGVLKPLPNAQLATRELYIRAKYEQRAFASGKENNLIFLEK